MLQTVFRFEASVSSEGTVTLNVPLPAGTLVEAVVVALEIERLGDPLDAASPVFAQIQRLEHQLDELRKENRQLKKSLGTLMCKDLPVNMDLTPEDGVGEPSLVELIAELEKSIQGNPQ